MSRYSNYNRDPYELTVKYDGVCAETGKQIKAGEKAVYYPTGKKLFAMDSKQAYDFRNWKADLSMECDY